MQVGGKMSDPPPNPTHRQQQQSLAHSFQTHFYVLIFLIMRLQCSVIVIGFKIVEMCLLMLKERYDNRVQALNTVFSSAEICGFATWGCI